MRELLDRRGIGSNVAWLLTREFSAGVRDGERDAVAARRPARRSGPGDAAAETPQILLKRENV
jgi:hypothetical protein